MKKLVVDSSVIIKWLNQQDEERTSQADKILEDAEKNKVILFTPELAKYEIGNALLIHKEVSVSDASVLFTTLFSFPIHFVSQSKKLANETYAVAQKEKITYYDASFIAVAKQENAILITDNLKHQGKSTEIKVISLADY